MGICQVWRDTTTGSFLTNCRGFIKVRFEAGGGGGGGRAAYGLNTRSKYW